MKKTLLLGLVAVCGLFASVTNAEAEPDMITIKTSCGEIIKVPSKAYKNMSELLKALQDAELLACGSDVML